MRKRSIGQWLVLIGNLVLCIGLILNGFEVISLSVFRVFVLIGLVIFIAALIVIWKRSEF